MYSPRDVYNYYIHKTEVGLIRDLKLQNPLWMRDNFLVVFSDIDTQNIDE